MAEDVIVVRDLVKTFRVPAKQAANSFLSNVKNLLYRKWEDKTVLKSLNFTVKEGEFVGYVGPNGAGKSTSIKLLTGILSPTSGEARVLGFVPFKQRYDYSYNIGVVFGQRSLLEFDIPVIESFKLYKDVYELSRKDFEARLDYFSKALKIDEFLHIPVRKLSLGQRMRCEIAASFLHNPKVVFLDEPTIGLDAIAKEEIRNFLKKINKENKTTIILTTHDMEDIEQTCERIIVIDEGKIIFDNSIKKLKKEYVKHKRVEVDYSEVLNKSKLAAVLKKTTITERREGYMDLRIDITKHKVPAIVDDLLECLDVHDLAVHSPRLESVIKEIYGRK